MGTVGLEDRLDQDIILANYLYFPDEMVRTTKQLKDEADLLARAVRHEREGEFDAAAKAYNKILTIDPHNVKIYDKLMRLHRDLKEYEKELSVINKAIKTFEKFYKEKTPVYNKTVTSLSKALLKATG